VLSTAILAFLLTINGTGGFNSCQHAFDVVEHLLVAKADDAIAILLELFCSGCVTLWLQVVDVTVYFHHQAARSAVEIGNEWSQRMLPPEFKPVQSFVPQAAPKQFLSQCHLPTEFASPLLSLGEERGPGGEVRATGRSDLAVPLHQNGTERRPERPV